MSAKKNKIDQLRIDLSRAQDPSFLYGDVHNANGPDKDNDHLHHHDPHEDEELLIPEKDSRKPISPVARLDIYQAYGLSPRTPNDKSMFRHTAYNPKRFQGSLSPGSQLGSYKRTPRASIQDLSPQKQSTSESLKGSEANVLFPSRLNRTEVRSHLITTNPIVTSPPTKEEAKAMKTSPFAKKTLQFSVTSDLSRGEESTLRKTHSSSFSNSSKTTESTSVTCSKNIRKTQSNCFSLSPPQAKIWPPMIPEKGSGFMKSKSTLLSPNRTSDYQADKLKKQVSNFQKFVTKTKHLEHQSESTSKEILG